MRGVRCGPKFFRLMRAPAMRNIGCERAPIVGCALRDVSAITFFDGLRVASGSGFASKASITSFGGNRYVDVARTSERISMARIVATNRDRDQVEQYIEDTDPAGRVRGAEAQIRDDGRPVPVADRGAEPFEQDRI